MNSDSDEQLMARLQAGEPEALDELYRRYARKLYAYCATTLSLRGAEDLVHDIFLRVIEAAGQFDPDKAPFGAWLYRIARNRGIDTIRRAGKVTFTPLQASGSTSGEEEGGSPENRLPDPGPSTAEQVAAADQTAAVRHCLKELTKEDERSAIVLYYLGGKVFREIGLALDRSTSMAQKLVKAAAAKVKACLEHKGVKE